MRTHCDVCAGLGAQVEVRPWNAAERVCENGHRWFTSPVPGTSHQPSDPPGCPCHTHRELTRPPLPAHAHAVRLAERSGNERDAARQEAARYRRALEFYAEIREYNRVGGDPVGTPPPIVDDQGRRARAALAPAEQAGGQEAEAGS